MQNKTMLVDFGVKWNMHILLAAPLRLLPVHVFTTLLYIDIANLESCAVRAL